MSKEKKELIKVSRGEIESVDDHIKMIQEQNAKIVALRKKQVYMALREATETRIKTAKNISHWIQMLSNKIFNPETIDEMDLNKAIALFKYVNNINLKVLSESNRLEEVLSKYIESGVMDTAANLQTKANDAARDKIKHEILSKLNKMFKEASDEAEFIPVEREFEPLTEDEEKELNDAERKLEDNLAAIDESIELAIDNDDDE